MPDATGPGLPAAPVCFSHTRAQALADGLLIDISDFAKEAFFRCPMAVSDSLFYNYLSPDYSLLSQGQSLTSRIQATLAALKTAICENPKARQLNFTNSYVMPTDSKPVPVEISATLHPGDDDKPVITLSLPEDNYRYP
jgi:hypothetical protein